MNLTMMRGSDVGSQLPIMLQGSGGKGERQGARGKRQEAKGKRQEARGKLIRLTRLTRLTREK